MEGEKEDRVRTQAQVQQAQGTLADPVEARVETDHPYANTLSDLTATGSARALMHCLTPTPSLESISEANAEDGGDSGTVKILQMQVKQLQQLMVECQ